METKIAIVIVLGVISLIQITKLIIKNTIARKENDVLITGIIANKLALEMCKTYLERPEITTENELNLVRKAVDTAIEKDEKLLNAVIGDASEETTQNLVKIFLNRGEGKSE